MHEVLWCHKRKVNLKNDSQQSTHRKSLRRLASHLLLLRVVYNWEALEWRNWNDLKWKLDDRKRIFKLEFSSKILSVTKPGEAIKKTFDSRCWSTRLFMTQKLETLAAHVSLRMHRILINQLWYKQTATTDFIGETQSFCFVSLERAENRFQCQFDDNFSALNWAMEFLFRELSTAVMNVSEVEHRAGEVIRRI